MWWQLNIISDPLSQNPQSILAPELPTGQAFATQIRTGDDHDVWRQWSRMDAKREGTYIDKETPASMIPPTLKAPILFLPHLDSPGKSISHTQVLHYLLALPSVHQESHLPQQLAQMQEMRESSKQDSNRD